MVESDSTGFNKRRAEGKDKADKPRNLQLKSRKLNPVNTICYVQVCKILSFFLSGFLLILGYIEFLKLEGFFCCYYQLKVRKIILLIPFAMFSMKKIGPFSF